VCHALKIPSSVDNWLQIAPNMTRMEKACPCLQHPRLITGGRIDIGFALPDDGAELAAVISGEDCHV
jgi:hypothetical protein